MLYGALMWGVTLYAFRRGGWTERTAAAGIIIATYLSTLLASPLGEAYRHIEVQVGMVDLALFIATLLIALKSRKYWPLWFAAMQGISLIGHLVPLVPGMPTSTYYNAIALWSYPMLILLAFAVRAHDRFSISGDRAASWQNTPRSTSR